MLARPWRKRTNGTRTKIHYGVAKEIDMSLKKMRLSFATFVLGKSIYITLNMNKESHPRRLSKLFTKWNYRTRNHIVKRNFN